MKLIEKTHAYQDWFMGLSDSLVKARIAARVSRLGLGHAGDAAPVGEGVSELRLHFGRGWRVYYTERVDALLSCWPAAPNIPKNVTSNWRCILRTTCRS